jgi:hypothetical protein
MSTLGHLVLFFFALSNPIALALDSSVSAQQASSTPGTNSFTSAFANGFTMVGATELGDKVRVYTVCFTNDPLSSSNATLSLPTSHTIDILASGFNGDEI